MLSYNLVINNSSVSLNRTSWSLPKSMTSYSTTLKNPNDQALADSLQAIWDKPIENPREKSPEEISKLLAEKMEAHSQRNNLYHSYEIDCSAVLTGKPTEKSVLFVDKSKTIDLYI